jgi:hypothetical protein
MESRESYNESLSTASDHTREIIGISLLLDIRELLQQGLKVSNEVHEMLWMERNPIFWVTEEGKPGRLQRIPPGGFVNVEKIEGAQMRKITPKDFETAEGELKEALADFNPQDGMVEMTSYEHYKDRERRGTYSLGATESERVGGGEGKGVEGDLRSGGMARGPRQESDPGQDE